MEYREEDGGRPGRTFAHSNLNTSGDVGKVLQRIKGDNHSEEVYFSKSRASVGTLTEQI